MSQPRSEESPFLELPATVVNKLSREDAGDVNIGKECRHVFVQSASLFIMYVAAAARDIAGTHKRTVVQAKDILQAMKELEFPEFLPGMEATLEAYKADQEAWKAAKEEDESAEQDDQEEDEEEPVDEEDEMEDVEMDDARKSPNLDLLIEE